MAEFGGIALQLGGTFIGGALFGPIGAQIGGLAGAYIGGRLFGDSEGQVREGPRLTDTTVSSSAYGSPIPWVFGTWRLSTNMIWATDIQEVTTEITEGGGKGGGGQSSTLITYSYFANAAYLCCRGEKDIIKIWADVKLIHDSTGSGQYAGAKYTGLITRYSGSTTQEPDPTIQEWLGVADTPAYRDACYFVIHDFPLEDFGNRLPQMQALVTDGADTMPYDVFDWETPYGPSLSQGALSRATWSNDHRYILISDDTMIDTLTQQVVVRNSNLANEIRLGARLNTRLFDDRIVNFDNLSTGYVSVIDPETLTGVATSGGVDMDFARHLVVCTSPVAPPPGQENAYPAQRIVVFGYRGAATVFDPNVLGDPVNGGESDAFPQMFRPYTKVSLTDAFPPPTDGVWQTNTSGGAVADRDGFAWVARSAGALSGPYVEWGLFKFDPWAGSYKEQITVPGGSDIEIVGLSYDPILHRIVVFCADIFTVDDDGAYQYDIDTNTWVDNERYTSINDDIGSTGIGNDNGTNFDGKWADNHKIWINETDLSNAYAEYDFASHRFVRQIEAEDWIGVITTDAVQYDPLQNAILTVDPLNGSAIYWLYLDRLTKNGVTLKYVVDQISNEVGLAAGDLDTTALASDTVKGYAVSRRSSARAALEPLRLAYAFDAAESDYQMRFVKRGGNSVLTLTDDDLGASNDVDADIAFVDETRLQEVELPLRYDVIYSDEDFEYQNNSQYSKRADEAVVTLDQQRLEAPIVFNAAEALDISERLLYTPWVEREKRQFVTTWQHLALDPTDVVTVSLDNGHSFEAYIFDLDTSTDELIEVVTALQRPELQTPRTGSAGADADGSNPSTLVPYGGSQFFIGDIPLLQDQDDGTNPILYSWAGRTGGTSGLTWQGVQLSRSLDSGVSYSGWQHHDTASEMTWGRSTDALAMTSAPFTWDRENTVNVVLNNGTLSSTSETNVLNGANAALLGSEVIQFATATLEADGTYTLSDLLRARRGTDLWARDTDFIAAHAAQERFVLLTDAATKAVYLNTANISTAMLFRGQTSGSTGTTFQSLTPLGYSKFPLAPHRFEGTRDGSGDVTLTWSRRTRTGGAVDWPAGPSRPAVAEAYEQYEIDVIDVNGTVVRTITVDDAETTTYTAAQQVADFGTDLDPINDTVDFIVYQISDVVGRGFPSLTLTA